MPDLLQEIKEHPTEALDAAYFLTVLGRRAYDNNEPILGRFLGYLSDLLNANVPHQ